MASDLGRTILVTLEEEPADNRPVGVRLAAFVPITIALFGVAAILIGGLSSRAPTMTAKQAVDPIVTGSITAHPE